MLADEGDSHRVCLKRARGRGLAHSDLVESLLRHSARNDLLTVLASALYAPDTVVAPDSLFLRLVPSVLGGLADLWLSIISASTSPKSCCENASDLLARTSGAPVPASVDARLPAGTQGPTMRQSAPTTSLCPFSSSAIITASPSDPASLSSVTGSTSCVPGKVSTGCPSVPSSSSSCRMNSILHPANVRVRCSRSIERRRLTRPQVRRLAMARGP